jgi:hypothetical protein
VLNRSPHPGGLCNIKNVDEGRSVVVKCGSHSHEKYMYVVLTARIGSGLIFTTMQVSNKPYRSSFSGVPLMH